MYKTMVLIALKELSSAVHQPLPGRGFQHEVLWQIVSVTTGDDQLY